MEPTIRQFVDEAMRHDAEKEAALQRRHQARRRRYVGAFISTAIFTVVAFNCHDQIKAAAISSVLIFLACILTIGLSTAD